MVFKNNAENRSNTSCPRGSAWAWQGRKDAFRTIRNCLQFLKASADAFT